MEMAGFFTLLLLPFALVIYSIPYLMKLGLYIIKFFDPDVVNDPQFQAAMKEDIPW